MTDLPSPTVSLLELSTPMEPCKEDMQSNEALSKTSDVVTCDGSELQNIPTPDPRWPYLGRWSSCPNCISPASKPSLENDSEAYLVTTTAPPADVTISTPPVSPTTELPVFSASATTHPATETTTTYPHPTTALPIASGTNVHLLETVDAPLSLEGDILQQKTLDSLTQAGSVLNVSSISSVLSSDPNALQNSSSLVVTNVLSSDITILPPLNQMQISTSEVNELPIISSDNDPQAS